MQGSDGLLTEYSIGVCKGQADYWLDIQSAYVGVRRMTDQILIWNMEGSNRLLTEYSISVCKGQADNQLEIEYLITEMIRLSRSEWFEYMDWDIQ